MTSSAFERISPAFPRRAPWGTSASLRAWQAEALEKYMAEQPQDFLAVATPGAGKTTFALRIASQLISQRIVHRVIVVVPTEHLKTQWADAASRVGLQIDPTGRGGRAGRSREYVGVATTYAAISVRPWHYEALCANNKTLVIFDEIHHAGDSRSWGEAVHDSFQYATRRLALTGTPFRSDDNPIPFVEYEIRDDGSQISRADYVYGYADALRDHVVRPVIFMAYGGPMRWITNTGDEIAANLGEPMTKALTSQAWRTALDPKGQWISSVLQAADKRLTQVRRHLPDAGGLVIASNQSTARAYARLLDQISGEETTVVLSDDAKSSAKIEEFSGSETRWMVAVRMVSEGVDVPRLAVGVYATSTSTPLFFAQAVGRFVRARKRGETATVFLPTVATILDHAASLELQRDHVLGGRKPDEGIWDESEALLEQANAREAASDELNNEFKMLDSDATFDHVLYDSHTYGMYADPSSRDEEEYLTLPGLADSDLMGTMLADRQRRQLARHKREINKQVRRKEVPPDEPLHRALANRRKELNTLVSRFARVRGVPHSHIHAQLRRECGGPKLAQANTGQVEARIRLVQRWLNRNG